jgi:hypothetical protein
MFQRSFAIDDQVRVHVVGREVPVLVSTADAGTRSTYYRRVRPTGERIDDIEASLAEVEDKARAPLTELIRGEPLTAERKGALAQFLGVQLMRGPAFFEQREELIVTLLSELQAEDLTTQGLAAVGGDVERARQRATEAYHDPTQRFMTMLTRSVKVATIFGHMRWHVLRFDGPVLAYSDHPIVLWPMKLAASRPFERQGMGPLSAVEVRVPLAPDVAIVMNWVDRSDEIGVRIDPRAAGELNAFTVSQADRQWMHRPGTTPEVPQGEFRPLSRLLSPRYDVPGMLRSARRVRAQRFIERVQNRQHVGSVEVILDVGPS